MLIFSVTSLFYDVTFREILKDEFDDLAEFITACLGQGWESNRGPNSGCVIVYCRKREATESLAHQVFIYVLRSAELIKTI